MSLVRFSHATDGELLGLTVEDPEAFGVFYDRFEVEVLGFFWRATRRADLAADLTAEVFAAALSSGRRLPSSARPVLGYSGSPDTSWPTPGGGDGWRIEFADDLGLSRSY